MRACFMMGRILFGSAIVAAAARYGWHAETWTGAGLAQVSSLAHGALLAGGVVLALAGTSLMLGLSPRFGLTAIAGLLALGTPLLHAFWSAPDLAARDVQLALFLQNLGLIGAALALVTLPQPWPNSIDSLLRTHSGGGQPPWFGAAVHSRLWLQKLLAAVRHNSARLSHAAWPPRARSSAALTRREPERAECELDMNEATPRALTWRAAILGTPHGTMFRVSRSIRVVSTPQPGESFVMLRRTLKYRVPLADSYG